MTEYSDNYLRAICFLLFIIVIFIILGFLFMGSKDKDCRYREDVDIHVSR